MDIEGLAAIAQVLGAVAVIFSLAYLAVQVRQNTRAQRVAAYSALKQAVRDINLQISGNPQISRVMFLAMSGRDSELSEEQEMQLEFFALLMFRTWEEAFNMRREGVLYTDAWLSAEGSIIRALSIPKVRSQWQSWDFRFDPQYKSRVDDLLEQHHGRSSGSPVRPSSGDAGG